jgi:hypothetical protein
MTDQATTAAEPNGAAPAAPRLLHSGIYALYETPDGGRHLSYQPTLACDEAGELGPVTVEDQHLPDVPPSALGLINAFLENGFPPTVLALLDGKMSPMRIMAALRDTGVSDAAE